MLVHAKERRKITLLRSGALAALVMLVAWPALGGQKGQTSASKKRDRVFSKEDEQLLLNLARWTLDSHIRTGEDPEPPANWLTPAVRKDFSCFVTLQKDGKLRACMCSDMVPHEPGYLNVMHSAVLAGTRDPRPSLGGRVKPKELADIQIEVTAILEAPKKLEFTDSKDLLKKLSPGVHGVILRTRYGRSTFIPQVWEQLPTKDKFLSRLCQKHGAPADYWRKGRPMIVKVYESTHFEEEQPGRRIIGPGGAVVGKKGATLLGHIKSLPKELASGAKQLKAGTYLPKGTILARGAHVIEPAKRP